MPQVLIYTLTFLFTLRNFFSTIQISDRTKKIIYGAIGLYLIYRIYKYIQREEAINGAIASDAGSLAIALHEAIFSQGTRLSLDIPLIGQLFNFHLGNGDESKVLELANSINGESEFKKISEIYKELYGFELSDDLSKILNSDEIVQFKSRVAKTKTLPTAPTQDTTVTQSNAKYVGKKVFAKVDNLNVRWASNSKVILYKAAKNELIGTYARSWFISGGWGLFHEVEPTGWFPSAGRNKRLVSANLVWFEQ